MADSPVRQVPTDLTYTPLRAAPADPGPAEARVAGAGKIPTHQLALFPLDLCIGMEPSSPGWVLAKREARR